MVAVPLSPAQLLALYPHAVVGHVTAVQTAPRPPHGGMTVADTMVTLAIAQVKKGSAIPGRSLVFHGETILHDEEGRLGSVSTIPASLAAGQRIEVYLEERQGRLVVPYYTALILLRPHPLRWKWWIPR